ncbi:MAG TPA: hotdog domain-containing protein, partial [Chthoniobacteraceae bacterium]|nr:hotdog domain-containing protein [Chthoniobacteraceae bacterium]
LQLEAMAQVGSVLLLRLPGQAGKIGFFMSADSVKFRKPVGPGDTLFIEVEMTQRKKAVAKAKGRCLVNGEVVSEAEMMFGLVDR